MSSRGAWSKLKQFNVDDLDSIGLPSKGDNRLKDPATQEQYYTRIVERFVFYCSNAGRGDELSRRFAKLDVSQSSGSSKSAPQVCPLQAGSQATKCMGGIDATSKNDISILVMAMRKLREGIVASQRIDDFSIQAYIFCIRVSIQLKHMESYHPALLHLLNNMHPVQPLTNVELQEFAGYLVLDLACRQDDLAQAYAVKNQYELHDAKVDAVLRALSHDNYFVFWEVKRSVDGLKAKVMEFAEKSIKKQALKCLGRSYLSIDQLSLEEYTNTTWDVLVKDFGVGWQLEKAKDGSKENSRVIIRKPKAR